MMEDDIDWKEAQSSGHIVTDSEDDEDSIRPELKELPVEVSAESEIFEGLKVLKDFSFEHINLRLRQNIASLADQSQHMPKPNYAVDNSSESFDSWIENALVTISPNADYLMFSSHTPEKLTFIAKIKKGPICQYVMKPLSVPLDYDEQVTSLLCIPIMSIQRTSLGSVDWTAFVVGLSSGYLKFYTEYSTCLLSLKFCDESIRSIKCQTKKINTNARSNVHFATIMDELLITFNNRAVIIDGLTLYENLKIAKNDVVRNGIQYEPAYNLNNLPTLLNCQNLMFNESTILDGELLGTRLTSLFDSLKLESIDPYAIKPKTFAKTLAFVGKYPFLSFYQESRDSSSHSYGEMIGSIFSLWKKPQPSQFQLTEMAKPLVRSLFDKDRQATSIVSSPDKRLAAITDDFGRVLLIDVTNCLVVRIWKGYRSAQCGWIEVKKDSEKRDSPYASLLVIYAPKRGLLEVWSAQRGPRIAAFNVGKGCRLLYSGFRMLNMRTDLLQKSGNITQHLSEQSYSSQCYLLNAKSETVFAIELPYTYSLYKHGDFKSRDHLLLNELSTAIEQDLEAEACSEIIHRMSLSESLEKSIQKVALGLNSSKVSNIMENLIIKIMKNYDNHAGETMTLDDESIIELCKRVIKLCSIFNNLSEISPREIFLPDVSLRLVDQYEEHPKEVDDFSKHLGWSSKEVLRCLSLLALERSFSKEDPLNPWPSVGEPLSWLEFVGCFNLNRIPAKDFEAYESSSSRKGLRLAQFNNKFLSSDKILKTSLFMFNRLSETFCKSFSDEFSKVQDNTKCYDQLEPTSRLILLFQFWLSTKLCNHWRMWAFLQSQADRIASELKSNTQEDSMLVNTWRQLYQMILESDNLFAAIIGTSTLRAITLKILQESEKSIESDNSSMDKPGEQISSIEWEHLCVDAERMSLIRHQLEDIFLLNLLLRYSYKDSSLVEDHLYRIPRISVANVLRSGPTIVSELVAQWIIQSGISLEVVTKVYGSYQADEETDHYITGSPGKDNSKTRSSNVIVGFRFGKADKKCNDEHVRELMHHVETAFPCSMERDTLLLYCVWELCRRWSSNQALANGARVLGDILECLKLIKNIELKHKTSAIIYKTFFQITFERLVCLVETNSTIVTIKNSRVRDVLTRKELNMSEDCLEDFVQFSCDLSEFMMHTLTEFNREEKRLTDEDIDNETSLADSHERLLALDNWWIAPPSKELQGSMQEWFERIDQSENSLVRTTLESSQLSSIDVLIELNKLSSLMNLIFKLKVIKAHPMSLIGEESRQILKLDLKQHQSKAHDHDHHQQQQQQIKSISSDKSQLGNSRPIGLLDELRRKFARKCILCIVCKLDAESNEFIEEDCIRELEAEANKNRERSNIRHKQKQPEQELGTDLFTTSGFNRKREQESTQQDDICTSYSQSTVGANGSGNSKTGDSNESLLLFSNLLSLATEWELDCDELHLDLVFELYRCNHDKIASQLSTRVQDKQTLANGLLKIASQRVLVLFELSPHLSGSEWRKKSNKWSLFAPNLVSWLKSIQQEEMKREIPCLSFSDSLRSTGDQKSGRSSCPGLHLFVLQTLRLRTKLLLDRITNNLDGQAARLARDLFQLLESQALDKTCDD